MGNNPGGDRDGERESEQDRKNSAIIRSLQIAGISRRYISPTEGLTQHGKHGQNIAARFDLGEAQIGLKNGRGFFFAGEDAEMNALFHLTCRAALLRGVSTRVTCLAQLRNTVMGDHDLFAENIEVLGVSGFYDSHFQRPLTDSQLFDVNYFFCHWMMQGRALILQSTDAIMGCKWWSPALHRLLIERSEVYSKV